MVKANALPSPPLHIPRAVGRGEKKYAEQSKPGSFSVRLAPSL